MKLTDRRNGGFTLIELLVSLVIFLVASMGLLPLLITNLQVNQGNGLHSQARRLAGEALATMQVVDYAELAVTSRLPSLHGTIELQRNVDTDQPQAGLSRLTVIARWEQAGKQHSYQLQSFRAMP
ncbi:MAG: type II secretion system protein [Desulfuromonadales bacterium]|jgi:prepilin-type N-terminal cleavage/methylation domain-containing protein|nr:type II secretion system protein [Desulfuromonadales bacterium]